MVPTLLPSCRCRMSSCFQMCSAADILNPRYAKMVAGPGRKRPNDWAWCCYAPGGRRSYEKRPAGVARWGLQRRHPTHVEPGLPGRGGLNNIVCGASSVRRPRGRGQQQKATPRAGRKTVPETPDPGDEPCRSAGVNALEAESLILPRRRSSGRYPGGKRPGVDRGGRGDDSKSSRRREMRRKILVNAGWAQYPMDLEPTRKGARALLGAAQPLRTAAESLRRGSWGRWKILNRRAPPGLSNVATNHLVIRSLVHFIRFFMTRVWRQHVFK